MKLFKKLSSISLLVLLILNISVSQFVFGEISISNNLTENNRYKEYSDMIIEVPKPDDSIVLQAKDSIITNGTLLESKYGKSNVVNLVDDSSISWSFEMPKEGVYSVKIKSHTDFGTNIYYRYAIMINGEIPYPEASSIEGSKIWKYESQTEQRFNRDFNDNEITPKQIEAAQWSEKFVYENGGTSSEPLEFYFKQGVNSISLNYFSGNIVIDSIVLMNISQPNSYDEVLKGWQESGKEIITKNEFNSIKIEGELIDSKSSPSIVPTMDKSTVSNSPIDAFKIVLNIIGNRGWNEGGEWINYKVDIDKSGLYRVDFKVRQDTNRGVSSSRKLLIDGEIQYKELENIAFPFSNDWYIKTLGDDHPILIYLPEGERNITIEVSSERGSLYRDLQEYTNELNSIYREIIMVTGPSPDPNRDYRIESAVPDLISRFQEISSKLKSLNKKMYEMGFSEGGEAIVVERVYLTLDSLINKPSSIPNRIALFKDNISALGSLMWTIANQPLELDYFRIMAVDDVKDAAKGNIWEEFVFGFKSYLASYMNDYTQIENKYDKNSALEVWVGQGREQAQIIKRLVNERFLPEFNIPVNINLVQQAPAGQTQSISTGLISATLTGRGPDISIFTSPNEIINLAAREAIVDVSQFEDFDLIKGRFNENSTKIFKYLDKYYALPVTQQFHMMFYRKDVFTQLEITPPNTWNDLYNILPIIQRNNLTVGIPSLEQTFQNLLFQNGGSYYVGDWEKSGFGSEGSLQAFKQWTELYTKYSLPVEFDPYSRFRTGEMPLQIAPFTLYNQLVLAAPEISGLWEMVPIPGTHKEDGSIDRSVSGIGSGIVMFNKINDVQAGWKFMKWWTSTEIQSEFGIEIEKIFGKSARFETANIEAFKLLPWETVQKEQLLEQWQNLQVVPLTPVTYYMTRDVNNAFRKAVYTRSNVRETLNYYIKDIDREIVRKRKQFDLPTE